MSIFLFDFSSQCKVDLDWKESFFVRELLSPRNLFLLSYTIIPANFALRNFFGSLLISALTATVKVCECKKTSCQRGGEDKRKPSYFAEHFVDLEQKQQKLSTWTGIERTN